VFGSHPRTRGNNSGVFGPIRPVLQGMYYGYDPARWGCIACPPRAEVREASRLFFDHHATFQHNKIGPRGVKGVLQRSRKLPCRFGSQEAEARAGAAYAHAYDAYICTHMHAYAQDGPMVCIRCRAYVRRCACGGLSAPRDPTPVIKNYSGTGEELLHRSKKNYSGVILRSSSRPPSQKGYLQAPT